MCFFSGEINEVFIYQLYIPSASLGGWPLTLSCYSTGLWPFVTEAISLTPLFT